MKWTAEKIRAVPCILILCFWATANCNAQIDISRVPQGDLSDGGPAISAQDLPRKLSLALPFFMVVEDTFGLADTGTVAAGAIARGELTVNDQVTILGDRKSTTTMATVLLRDRTKVDTVAAGESVGVVLRGMSLQDIRRGMLIVSPGSMQMGKAFRAKISLNADVNVNVMPASNQFDLAPRTGFVQIFLHAIDRRAEYFLLEENAWQAGGETNVTIDLDDPTGLSVGMTFLLRNDGRRIGTGTVTEVLF